VPTGRGEHLDPSGHDAAEALLAAVRELVADLHRGYAEPVVDLDSRLDADLGLDSLSVAELLVRTEELFGVSFPEATLVSARAPRDLLTAAAAAVDRVPSGVDEAGRTPLRTPSGTVPAVPSDARTLLDVLDRYAEAQPERVHLRLLSEHGVEDLTYGDLRHEAAEVAGGLRQRRVPVGASVAIMLPTGREYFLAFFGALLAGCVPVPIYPPGRPSGLEDHLRRHVGVLDNAQAATLVTVPEARPLARLVAPQIPTLQHVVTVGELRSAARSLSRPTVAGSDTALLQYTSGSTGDPKGVVLSHANLLANIRATRQAAQLEDTDVFVSWLPLYHDMGLIGSWLLSLYAGIPFVVMSPMLFLTRPSRWLQAISDHGGTVSGGPNFAYELCVRRVEDRDLAGIDLSSWRIAFNGAEPVSPDTVTRFIDRFAPHGFDPGAVTPVYGLAECTVALTTPPLGRGPRIDTVSREPLARSGRAVPAAPGRTSTVRFVACGRPLPEHELRIVDEAGDPVGERREGRVEFRGPSATSGYLRNPDATRRLFRDGWLDTGDLGYLADGELYPTGRVKDVIIRAGRNLHPSDLEEVVGSVPAVRTGCVAAFASTDPATGTERLVVLAETRLDDAHELDDLRRAVLAAATDLVGVPPDEVVLVPPGTVPKTSSGKIRRAAARERYEHGALEGSPRAVWWQLSRIGASSFVAATRRAGPRAAATLYGAWALGAFGVVAAVTGPLIALAPTLRLRWRLVRGAGRLLAVLTGVRVDVEGAHHLPRDRPFVLVANHASHVDPLVLTMLLEEPAVFAAVADLADNPFVRLGLRRMHAHLVERGDRVRGVADAEALTGAVRAGRTVVFFPEGRRSPALGLEPFQTGAFLVAARSGAPVVPVAIRGTRTVLPVGRLLPRRTTVTVTVGPPVTTQHAGWQGAMELQREARRLILRHCGEPDLA
jgi:1-acyl-sn-glycerol-3-phosphate acyltransferase